MPGSLPRPPQISFPFGINRIDDGTRIGATSPGSSPVAASTTHEPRTPARKRHRDDALGCRVAEALPDRRIFRVII
jgi:hypothetical protein